MAGVQEPRGLCREPDKVCALMDFTMVSGNQTINKEQSEGD